MGKTIEEKPHWVNLRSLLSTLKNPLLSIISGYKYKESYQTLWPIPKYQPTVEPLSQYSIGLVL